jgi:PAS domain-containing protein
MTVPDPAPLFVCIVAFAGSLSGLASGLATAAFAVTALAFFHHHGADFGSADLVRQAMLSVTVTGTAIITGLLRKRLMDAFGWERKQHAAAERLSAALDQVEIGIVLLDADTRAEFINRAFRDYFALPDEKADSKPPFIALMHHGRDVRAWEMPEDELNEFIAQRIRLMRAGDQTPINIELRNGQVLRFSCTALPDGGRMLSYTPVTDLVRHTDDPAQIDYYQSLRGGGIRGGTTHLRAAE